MVPFELMAGFGSLMVVALLPFLLLALAIPYAVAQLREAREGEPDPQLGFKVALNYFFSLSLLILLLGLTVLVVDLLQSNLPRRGGAQNEFPNEAQRVGFALVCSGFLFIVLHFLGLLLLTTGPFTSPVRRTFLGWRFAVHGLVVMLAFTALLIILFQRRDATPDEFRRFLIGTLIVWTPSWFIHLVLFRVSSTSTWRPSRESMTLEDDDLLPPYRQ